MIVYAPEERGPLPAPTWSQPSVPRLAPEAQEDMAVVLAPPPPMRTPGDDTP